MAKREHDPLITKPLPSTSVPWLAILFLIFCIGLVFAGFLRQPDNLFGPSLEKNTYVDEMKAPKITPKPVVQEAPDEAANVDEETPATPAAKAIAQPAPVKKPVAKKPTIRVKSTTTTLTKRTSTPKRITTKPQAIVRAITGKTPAKVTSRTLAVKTSSTKKPTTVKLPVRTTAISRKPTTVKKPATTPKPVVTKKPTTRVKPTAKPVVKKTPAKPVVKKAPVKPAAKPKAPVKRTATT